MAAPRRRLSVVELSLNSQRQCGKNLPIRLAAALIVVVAVVVVFLLILLAFNSSDVQIAVLSALLKSVFWFVYLVLFSSSFIVVYQSLRAASY